MYLGIDLGTTNIKAVVVDSDGLVAARAAEPFEMVHTPDGG